MSPNITTEQAQEMAALHALGALTQHETRAFQNLLTEDNNENNGLAEELAAFDSVTELLAFAAPECEPSASVREKLLAKTAAPKAAAEFHVPFAMTAQTAPVFSLMANEGDWTEIGPGLAAKTLFIDQTRGLVTSLVKMAPGGALPPHRHMGDEQFYVLEGDCNVHGTRLGPGDFHRAASGSVHESTYTVDGTTFLLIAPADYEILQPALA